MLPKKGKSTVSDHFWMLANTPENGLSTLDELTRGKKKKTRQKNNLHLLAQNGVVNKPRPATAYNPGFTNYEPLSRGEPYGFLSKVGGVTIQVRDSSKPKREPKANNFLLQSRVKVPDVETRAISAMNTVQIDKEIDSNLYRFGKNSSSTNEIEHRIRSHKYVMSKKNKYLFVSLNLREFIPLEDKIKDEHVLKKPKNVRPYTASALLTDKQQVRITTPFSHGNKKQSIGEMISEDQYQARLRELDILEDPAESEEEDDYDELDDVEELKKKFGVREDSIRRPLTSTGDFHTYQRPRPDSKMKIRPLSGLTQRRPISSKTTFRPENYFTHYRKEVTNIGDDIPFEELFDRNERTLCATFAKFGDLSYHTPNKRIGSYYQFNAKLTSIHLKEIIALQNTITNVEKNEFEIPIQLAIIDEMNIFQKKIKTGISSVFKKEEVEREPVTNSLYPEYFEDSSEEDDFEGEKDTGKAARKYFEKQLREMGGSFDPTFLGKDNYLFVDLRFIDQEIKHKIELSTKRYTRYIEDENFIKNDEISKYKREWMSQALKLVPETLLKWNEELVRTLFHEIFRDYRAAIRKCILDYLLLCPEERRRLYIDLIVREVPTSNLRISNAGGYSLLLYSDWHSYVETAKTFLQTNLYSMNIVNSSLLDWNEDFRGITMVETELTRHMAVSGYAMKIDSFLKVQKQHRSQIYAFFKHIWLRGAYLIMKKFKYFRVSKEKKGMWTLVGHTQEDQVDNDFLETLVEMNQTIKQDQTEDLPETIFHVLSGAMQNRLAEKVEMPLVNWANIRINDLQDIRDSSAYNYYALVNKEPLLLEENGYKLLDKDVRKKLRRSVGLLLSLQLRERVKESVEKLEDLILTIKPFSEEVELHKVAQSKCMETIGEDDIIGGLMDGNLDVSITEALPPQITKASTMNQGNLKGTISKLQGSESEVKSQKNISMPKRLPSYSNLNISALREKAIEQKEAGRAAGKLQRNIFKVDIELELPDFMKYQNLFLPFLKLEMAYNGNELKFVEEEDSVKAAFIRIHEEIVTSFSGLPHPEFVSINVLDQTVEQHMDKNFTIDKNYDAFYKTFLPFVDMREKNRKKKPQSILETVKVEEVSEGAKIIQVNSLSETFYTESSERIASHVLKLYRDSTASFQIFKQLRLVYEKKYVKNIQNFIDQSTGWTVYEFKDQLVSVNSFINLNLKVPGSIYFPLFEIDTTTVKRYISNILEDLREKLHSKILTFFHSEINTIRDSYEALSERMGETISSAKEYEEMERFMGDLAQEKILLLQKSSALFEKILYISNLHIGKINDTYSKARELFSCPETLETHIRTAEFKHAHARKEIIMNIDNKNERYRALICTIDEELEKNEGMTDFNNYSIAIVTFNNIDTKISEVEALREEIIDEEKRIYGKSTKDYPEAAFIRAGFNPTLKLWRSVNNLMSKKDKIFDSLVHEVNPGEVDKLVRESQIDHKRILQLFDETDSKFKIIKKFKEEVEYLQECHEAIEVVCNKGLQDRHWNKIVGLLPFEFDHRNHDLRYLLEESNNLKTLIDPISEISQKATNEYKLHQMLEKIKADWKVMRFELAKLRGGDVSVLQGQSVEEIQLLLDDHVIKAQTITSDPAVSFMQDEAKLWQESLRDLQNIIEVFVEVQSHYIYLEPIFNSEDIKSSLKHENSMFEGIHKTWEDITDIISADTLAMKLLKIPNLQKTLTDSLATMEKIKKSLDDYLNNKRTKFARFYFLSNDEMLSILSETKDPLLVQPHLKKCFEGINQLVFTPDSEIIGMRSLQGEVIDFNSKVVPKAYKGAVEEWLIKIEEQMYVSLASKTEECLVDIETHLPSRIKWIKKWPGQCILCCSQITWTHFVQENMNILKKMKDLQATLNSQIDEIVGMVRGDLSPIERLTIGALITIEVHAKDIVQDMIINRVNNLDDFTWQSQLRYYYSPDSHMVTLKMLEASLAYGYEYLGNSERLVITPLTDRCYRTLMSALHLNLGGAPEGPAGTGKTETTKDLAKAVALQCVVFNCSEGIDVYSMGKFFTGLVTTGAWSCFDEFNRIQLEVLSVIAQQIHKIQAAKAARESDFIFEGVKTKIKQSCNIFITMNPGYAGRSELPDNLKVLFRPVAMMVPDYADIAEISLYSVGFYKARDLATKIVATYKLCSEQLSSQYHYDYGMRAVKSVLITAGVLKRKMEDEDEQYIIYLAIKEANIPKFVQKDIPIFLAILSDLFPDIKNHQKLDEILKDQIIKSLRAKKLLVLEKLIIKIFQLYDIINTRHGLMLVGGSMSGKSTVYQILADALTSLNMTDPAVMRAKYEVINPKSVTIKEIYGYTDLISKEWTEGLLAEKFKRLSKKTLERYWIVFDGPVDADWIENLNTVLDDNKVLCLMNSDKIPMSPSMTMMFETDDLSKASPATVSRCGMVYLPDESIGARNIFLRWLDKFAGEIITPEMISHFTDLYDTIFLKAERFLSSNCKLLHEFSETVMAENFTKYLAILLKEGKLLQANVADMDFKEFQRKADLLFVNGIAWSLGTSVRDEFRKPFDKFIRRTVGEPAKSELDDEKILKFDRFIVPPESQGSLMIDYNIDFTTYTWDNPKDLLLNSNSLEYVRGVKDFYDICVETEESMRIKLTLKHCMNYGLQMLLIGPTGIGKTQIIQSQLKDLKTDKTLVVALSFSAKTEAEFVRKIIDSKIEKKRRDTFWPLNNGRKGVIFIDDLNLPAPDKNGFQSSLELLRQYYETGGWYDLHTLKMKYIVDFMSVSAMGPPGGNRSSISMRLLRYYFCYTSKSYDENTMGRIFKVISDWICYCKHLGADATRVLHFAAETSVELYNKVHSGLKATPTKPHYLFNLRDISKVFQGIALCDRQHFDSPKKIARLWLHETSRVFVDRLLFDEDRAWMYSEIKHVLNHKLREDFQTIMSEIVDKDLLIDTFHDLDHLNFTDIVSDAIDLKERQYIEEKSIALIIDKLDDYLVEYNLTSKNRMNVCFFEHAARQIMRICRVLKMDRGNSVLLGLGGSGRQTLTRVSSFIMGQQTIDLEVTKNYSLEMWREDAKKIVEGSSLEGDAACLLLTESQISKDYIMQDIDSLLNMGEIPNLYNSEEFAPIEQKLREIAKRSGDHAVSDGSSLEIIKYFIERNRKNLHIIILLSSVGNELRHKIRNFPSLVNCCSLINFTSWPEEALQKIGSERIEEFLPMLKPEKKLRLIASLKHIHNSSISLADEYWRVERRKVYITPAMFLEFIENIKLNYDQTKQRLENKTSQYKSGIQKITENQEFVAKMSIELEEKKPKLITMNEILQDIQDKIDKEEEILRPIYEKLQEEEKKLNIEYEKLDILKADCEEALSIVKPAFEKAKDTVKKVEPRDLVLVRSYTEPTAVIKSVMACICILLGEEIIVKDGKKQYWASAKKLLANTSELLETMCMISPEDINIKGLNQVRKEYLNLPELSSSSIKRASNAMLTFFNWIKAIDKLEIEFRKVKPKQDALNEADVKCQEMKAILNEKRAECSKFEEKIKELQQQQRENQEKRNELQEDIRITELRFERATILIEALAEEKVSWLAKAENLSAKLPMVLGDTVLSSAIMTYLGPFSGSFLTDRQILWKEHLNSQFIKVRGNFSLEEVVGEPIIIMKWTMKGLPNDRISREKALTIYKQNKCSLIIDPQGQACKWMKSIELENKVISTKMDKRTFTKDLEFTASLGLPLIVENCGEFIDPILYPFILRQSFKAEGTQSIKLGDKIIEFKNDFRLYLFSRLENPHYTPEITAKTNLINFGVTEEGLEDQLLQVTVNKERPDIEERRRILIEQNHENNEKMEKIEQEILTTLQNCEGNILDNEDAINTLKKSKEISISVMERQENAKIIQEQNDEARKVYKTIASHGTLLFFACNHMSKVNKMYQYSLSWYLIMFERSLSNAEDSSYAEQRTENVIKEANKVIYSNICRGLYEKDKLTFSLILALMISLKKNEVDRKLLSLIINAWDTSEFADKTSESKIISNETWRKALFVGKQLGDIWDGIAESLSKKQAYWEMTLADARPELMNYPAPFDKLSSIEKVLLMKIVRPDSLMRAYRKFASDSMGSFFVKPPGYDLQISYEESTCNIPVLFLLPGLDPMQELIKFSLKLGKTDVKHISLGQDQGKFAEAAILEAKETGTWVILENCHLYPSWMTELSRIAEGIFESKRGEDIHRDFRLFLTTYQSKDFPHNILQHSVKLANEPPEGLGTNMTLSYRAEPLIDKENFFEAHPNPKMFSTLVYSVCFFHAIIQERRNYGALGWNIPYEFNMSDLRISLQNIFNYTGKSDKVPYDALYYLIGECNYGGRVTDDRDRLTLKTLLADVLNPKIFYAGHRFAELEDYIVPEYGKYEDYLSFIDKLPSEQPPELFGLHQNAIISKAMKETAELSFKLISVLGGANTSQGEEADIGILTTIKSLIGRCPKKFNIDLISMRYQVSQEESLNTVLLQEVSRYNRLLEMIQQSLKELERATKGEIVMSAELEHMSDRILSGLLPNNWKVLSYPSLKPLGSYYEDLSNRIKFLSDWVDDGMPKMFWISGFFFAHGFLTGVLQNFSRKEKISIDKLEFAYEFENYPKNGDIEQYSRTLEKPDSGCYIYGLYLEGCGWDELERKLVESTPGLVSSRAPIILLQPRPTTVIKRARSAYHCPVYLTSERRGVLSTTGHSTNFLMYVDTDSDKEASHWIKRGVAMISQLSE